jgi:hypothetical protein
MLKELIQKKHPCKKSKSNERGSCPILPDFAHRGYRLSYKLEISVRPAPYKNRRVYMV